MELVPLTVLPPPEGKRSPLPEVLVMVKVRVAPKVPPATAPPTSVLSATEGVESLLAMTTPLPLTCRRGTSTERIVTSKMRSLLAGMPVFAVDP